MKLQITIHRPIKMTKDYYVIEWIRKPLTLMGAGMKIGKKYTSSTAGRGCRGQSPLPQCTLGFPQSAIELPLPL